jgi:hypothetical protein
VLIGFGMDSLKKKKKKKKEKNWKGTSRVSCRELEGANVLTTLRRGLLSLGFYVFFFELFPIPSASTGRILGNPECWVLYYSLARLGDCFSFFVPTFLEGEEWKTGTTGEPDSMFTTITTTGRLNEVKAGDYP